MPETQPESGLTDHLHTPPVPPASRQAASSDTVVLPTAAGVAAEGAIGRLDHYRLIAELGSGGMGVVYRAVDESLRRTVAIKILRRDRLDEEARLRFVREAQAAAQVRHANVVGVHAVVTPPNEPPYLVMEHVEGCSLRAYLKEHGPLPPRRAAEFCAQLADGLAAAHAAGLIHRDIKPANVMLEAVSREAVSGEGNSTSPNPPLTSHHSPRLMDFGLARPIEHSAVLTQEGVVVGTPAYMSPEQIRNPAVDQRSDVYSLGATFYEMLTGNEPFRGTTAMVLKQVLEEEPRPPRRLNDAIPADLETICLKAMAKEPERRYPTAVALGDDLRRWLHDEPIHARPASRGERALKWIRRRPAAAGLIAVSVIAAATLLAVSAIYTWQLRTAQQQAQANYRRTLRTVERMLIDVSDEQLAHVPRMEQVRKELLQSALALLTELLQERGKDPEVRALIGRLYARIGNLYRWVDEPIDKAAAAYEQAVAYLQPLTAEYPENDDYNQWLAAAYYGQAVVLRDTKRVAETKTLVRQALDLQERLTAAAPEHPDYLFDLAQTELIRGWMAMETHDWATAEEALQRRLKLFQRLVSDWPDRPRYHEGLGRTYHFLAWLRADQNSSSDSALFAQEGEFLARAITVREQLVKDFPLSIGYQQDLGYSYGNQANHLRRTRQFERAHAVYRSAIQHWQNLANQSPAIAEYQSLLALQQNNLVACLLDEESPPLDQCLELIQEAMKHQQAALAIKRDHVDYRVRLGWHKGNLAEIYLRLGRHAEAAAIAREYASLVPERWMFPLFAAGYLARAGALAEKDERLDEAERRRLRQQYDKEAFRLLREAVRRGFRDFGRLERDQAFAELRSQAGFPELISELRGFGSKEPP